MTPEEVKKLRQMRLIDVAKREHVPIWRIPFMMIRGRRMMSQRIGEVQLFDGMDSIIKKLYTEEFRLLIMSSNSTSNIDKFLKVHRLDQYFEKIYGGAGLFGKKRLLHRILHTNRLTASECVYIGDESRDVQASKEVGMPCISVCWGFNDESVLRKYQPEAVAKKPDDLLKIIDQLVS